MLDFDDEIKKFKPSLDVDNVEDAIKNQDLTDVIDLIRELGLTVAQGHKE